MREVIELCGARARAPEGERRLLSGQHVFGAVHFHHGRDSWRDLMNRIMMLLAILMLFLGVAMGQSSAQQSQPQQQSPSNAQAPTSGSSSTANQQSSGS